jgi:sulfite oxidase
VDGKPLCSGTDWNLGAISTAKFAGVSLKEVLAHCGHDHSHTTKQGVQHVVFEGADGVSASIPIQKALCPGECVMLAYEMNDEPIPRDHGYPVRVVVPGHVGVRNVKWVTKLHVSKEEAMGPWQRGIAYKGFSPSQITPAGVDIEKLVSLQEMPVQSAMVYPLNSSKAEVNDGKMSVRGYAWSGGGRGIIRVDVSADGGQSWCVPLEASLRSNSIRQH